MIILPAVPNQSNFSCKNPELDPNQYKMPGCTNQRALLELFLDIHVVEIFITIFTS